MPALGLIPGGRQELSEAIQGMGESANLEQQGNMADANIKAARKSQYMNMGGSLGGMAIAKGAPMAMKWMSASPAITGNTTAATSAGINSGAIGAGTGTEFAPISSFAVSPEVSAVAAPSWGVAPSAAAAIPEVAAAGAPMAAGAASAVPVAAEAGAGLFGAGAGLAAAGAETAALASGIGAAAAGTAATGTAATAAGMSITEFLPILLGLL